MSNLDRLSGGKGEEENGWERFQGDDRASSNRRALVKQIQALYVRQIGM